MSWNRFVLADATEPDSKDRLYAILNTVDRVDELSAEWKAREEWRNTVLLHLELNGGIKFDDAEHFLWIWDRLGKR
jgi:hypothetical protein